MYAASMMTRHALLSTVLFALACSGVLPKFKVAGVETTVTPPIGVEAVKVDDTCSKLLDFCVKVQCDAKNVSKVDARGEATVEMYVKQGDAEVKKSTPVALGPGQRETLSQTFPEAKLFGQSPEGGCRVVPGHKVEVHCAIVNEGADGRFDGEVELVMKSGESRYEPFDLDVASGATETAVVRVAVSPSDVVQSRCRSRRKE